ncbi:NUDIX hydrolase [Marinobacter zhanjiangensis]|uniref:Phosphatase NudJ n=1 Tax=Marinobacter zhanjiangensis TaxID=578215 RepID=A0ABQ3BD49_9GAMM|nr:NUDIX hydrolase [Marinobacter zhanjiangensis]GGY84874.1 NUDIX hydrolase [Marinobacter zhanjiangensis]
MTWKPHATVAVIVEDDRGRFLLVEEHISGQIVFNQPAGHIEEGEAITEAARREALEETGWEVEPEAFLGMYRYIAPANGVTYFRFCFAARPLRHVTDQLDDDIVAAHWLTLDEIRGLGSRLRSPMVLDCILDYRDGRRFPLDIIVEPEAK